MDAKDKEQLRQITERAKSYAMTRHERATQVGDVDTARQMAELVAKYEEILASLIAPT